MAIGRCFVPLKHLVSLTSMERPLRSFSRSMRKKEGPKRRSRLRSSGMRFWNLKLKLEILSCSTKTRQIVSASVCPHGVGISEFNGLISFFAIIGKSNQKNLGTIKSSNLCTEIIEYSAPDEVAVCNLASIALPTYITNGVYDFQKLHDVTKEVTLNLNRIIDVNYYPVPEAKKSNMRHRPIGIGVQGLADAFQILKLPFDSPEAKKLNTQIFETLYHAGLEASNELAQKDGPYETFPGSPASKGELQYDMWGVTPTNLWEWDSLKEKIKTSGLRNSLLLAPMPTASTSQILGFNECFEPYTS